MFDHARVLAALTGDPEFALHARFWSCSLAISIGDQVSLLKIRDGAPTSFATGDGPAEVRISAPADGWGLMMSPLPPPFFHDLMAAVAREGFSLDGANLDHDFRPYYPAIRRLIEVMRACTEEASHAEVR